MSVANATSNGSGRFGRVAWAPAEGTEVSLDVPAHPEYVSLVRHTLGGIAGPLGMDEEAVAGMRLAVTEACTNVVRHAYPDRPGPMEVRVRTGPEAVQVVVRDRGQGLRPRATADSLGVGLPLIAALTDEMRVAAPPDGGTLLAMSFRRRGRRDG